MIFVHAGDKQLPPNLLSLPNLSLINGTNKLFIKTIWREK
jgi:hypothetical protein